MKRHEREYLAVLSGMDCKTNIISAYPLTKQGHDRANYAPAKTVVPELCRELNIDAIFPDNVNLTAGIRTIDWEDLRDNVIGETIRVKYRPTRTEHPEDHDLLQRLHAEHDADIRKLAKLHARYHLWQRAVTDGSILFTHDGYWYSSQTKTDKTKMTPNDYSLTSFDEGHRAVTYTWRKLPSSDVPEHLLLSSLLSMHGKRPKLMVHFHHYNLTRGDRYRELVTHKKLEYGQFASGRHLLKDIRHKMSMWLVMREHGQATHWKILRHFFISLGCMHTIRFTGTAFAKTTSIAFTKSPPPTRLAGVWLHRAVSVLMYAFYLGQSPVVNVATVFQHL